MVIPGLLSVGPFVRELLASLPACFCRGWLGWPSVGIGILLAKGPVLGLTVG